MTTLRAEVAMNTVFYISSVVAVIATVLVITRLNAVHALLYFIVSLLSVALIFFTLGAPFAAALEVIIYAGAIMVLFLFVVMTLNLGPGTPDKHKCYWAEDRRHCSFRTLPVRG
jgi:NADH-quinone oxidoreductase subunit J